MGPIFDRFTTERNYYRNFRSYGRRIEIFDYLCKLETNIRKIMRKPNLMCLIALLTLSSCEEDGTPATESWVIIVVFIVIFIIVMIHENIKSGKVNEEAKAKGDDPHSYKEIGTYIGGHPSVDKQKTYVLARKNDQVIEFWEGIMGYNGEFSSSHPDKIEGFEIPIEAVEDIRIEDKTSIEREVGAGRMFLVGMYAFAWKKKKKMRWHSLSSNGRKASSRTKPFSPSKEKDP